MQASLRLRSSGVQGVRGVKEENGPWRGEARTNSSSFCEDLPFQRQEDLLVMDKSPNGNCQLTTIRLCDVPRPREPVRFFGTLAYGYGLISYR
jgi:hypothetical protein